MKQPESDTEKRKRVLRGEKLSLRNLMWKGDGKQSKINKALVKVTLWKVHSQ